MITLTLTAALDGGGWLTPCPGCFTPPGMTQYPLYRRMGEPKGWCGMVKKIWTYRDSIPRPSRLWWVAPLTILSQPTIASAVLRASSYPWQSNAQHDSNRQNKRTKIQASKCWFEARHLSYTIDWLFSPLLWCLSGTNVNTTSGKVFFLLWKDVHFQ